MICRIDLLATVGIKACLNTSDEQVTQRTKVCYLNKTPFSDILKKLLGGK